jgi:hypothetical protein
MAPKNSLCESVRQARALGLERKEAPHGKINDTGQDSITQILEYWWLGALGLRGDEAGILIDRHAYTELHRNLFMGLRTLQQMTGLSLVGTDLGDLYIQSDWEIDSQGRDCIDLPRLSDMLLELAAAWCGDSARRTHVEDFLTGISTPTVLRYVRSPITNCAQICFGTHFPVCCAPNWFLQLPDCA